ncbi:DUF885 domain-containing protein [Qipengyuania qiaonensis]|uniref:DUF885 domain-containing protein n=1 Tax=Qipengyuania qiaonensis TaxID=2867240 RepID=A0ABS7JCZ9_9SPHN|nr:DUF885 domain-containing protein [Qipengyuania qiaonensis]MBX7483704.1 DUF885 domain-containing protein [Qipengyuania qiaonensis]
MRFQNTLLLAAAPVALFALAAPAFGQTAASETAEVAPDNHNAELRAWFDAKYEEQVMDSPLWLTSLGRKERYGEIDDFSIAAQDEDLAWLKASVEEMEQTFDYDSLNATDKLSYDLWKYEYERAAQSAEWRDSGYVFTQMQGAHTFLPRLLISQHRVATAQDMRDYISRVSAIGRALGQLVDIAEPRAAAGVRPPYFAYDFVIDESQKLISGAPFDDGADNALWQDGKAKIAALVEAGTITAAEGETMQGELEAALKDGYKAGYDRVIAFMTADKPNASEIGVGVGSLPNGTAYYGYRLADSTTTDLTPEQVHRIGLDDVERIHAEMEAIKDEVGFDGDLQAFFAHIKEDPDNYFPQGDEGAQMYIDAAAAAIDNIESKLPQYFGLLPKAALEVKRVEKFREQDGGAQHYSSGTPDGSRPGVYYAHLSDMSAMPKNMLEVIAYHEGLPGHHMQISIAQELTGVPKFQTQLGYGVYAEGWGLYSERLAKEMPGAYEDPYSDFGRLSSELWRAIRLVVDTGIHSKGWTEDQAIAYFTENSPQNAETIRNEVRRYIVMPGQATSYKIGMNKILDLRARAESELGDDFDIRGFHDAVLGGGSLPLSLLERRVDAWIAERKAA